MTLYRTEEAANPAERQTCHLGGLAHAGRRARVREVGEGSQVFGRITGPLRQIQDAYLYQRQGLTP